MRKYQDNNTQLVTVICNRCKKELKVENGILKEGCFEVSHAFGYFSERMDRCINLTCANSVLIKCSQNFRCLPK